MTSERTTGAQERPARVVHLLTGGLGRNFALLWAGWSVSSIGNGLTATAIPLLAAYFTTDPNEVAFVSFALKLPWLAFALIGGVLADRLDRRKAMVGSDVIRFFVIGFLAVFVVLGGSSIWVLAAVAFLVTSVDTVYDVARASILPMLVSSDQDALQRANSRLMTVNVAVLRFAGPVLGGVLFAVLHELPFYADAITFLVAAAMVWCIRGDYSAAGQHTPAVPEKPPRKSLWLEALGSLSWLFRHRLLGTITVVAGLYNMITWGQLAVLVLYATELMHLDEAAYGVLLASVAVGSVLAGFVARGLSARCGPVAAAFGAMCAGELAYGSLGLWHHYAVVAVALAVTGAASMIWNVHTVSLRQSLVPAELMGRVNGGHRLVLFGLQPFGALLGGALAAHGLQAPYLMGAPVALLITSTGWVLATKAHRALNSSV